MKFVLHHYRPGRFDPRKGYERFARSQSLHVRRRLWPVWAAAGVATLVAFGAYWWLALRLTTLSAGTVARTFVLDDSTRVVLAPGATLSWRGVYDRRLAMTGRVYFEVRHDDRRPFTVVDDRYFVDDLGTCFEIVEEERHTRVLVTEGSVRFGDAKGHRRIDLREGMEAVLRHGEPLPRLLEKPNTNHAAWATHRFHFDRTPLRRALADLEAYYGVPLRTTEPNRLLTGDFSADSLETLLKVIEQAMDVEIEALSGQSGKPTPALPKGG